MPATAVLIPTTRPSPSASAPPELPGLSAASVWITFSTRRPAEPELGRQRSPEGGHDAGGHGAGQSHRAADRDDELADAQVVRVAQLGGRQVAGVDTDHGQVGERIRPDHLRAQLAPVREGGADAAAAGDHVGRGQHVAVGRDRDAAAGALGSSATGAPGDGQVRDRWRQPLGDSGHRPGVGVEGVGIGQALRARCSRAVGDPVGDQLELRH